MLQIAKRLKEFQPDNVEWTISLAYATRRTYSIDVAMEILPSRRGEVPKRGSNSIQSCVLLLPTWRNGKAKHYLKKAFEIDLSWRKAALEDEDLKPFWDSLQTTVE